MKSSVRWLTSAAWVLALITCPVALIVLILVTPEGVPDELRIIGRPAGEVLAGRLMAAHLALSGPAAVAVFWLARTYRIRWMLLSAIAWAMFLTGVLYVAA